MYRVLSLDGGGIRSIFTARLIERLEAATGFLQGVDLIAGNSGGAIVAAAIASGLSPNAIVQVFLDDGPKIFERRRREGVLNPYKFFGARYGDQNKRHVLGSYFSDRQLDQVSMKLVITAFDLRHHSGRWQPVAFHNFPGSRHKKLSLVDAVMASTAAQTYFPVYQLGDSKYSDGGVWANNPSMSALAESVSEYRGRQRFEDVVILNIGTILNQIILDSSTNNLGVYGWVRNGLIDLLLDSGAMDAVDYYCRSLLGPRFHRLNLVSRELIRLDDVASMRRLIDLADSIDLSDTKAWMAGFWH